MSIIIPVLLAGGEGKRLRPLSSSSKPKQFLSLIKNNSDSLFQSSAKRALELAEAENIITIASENYQDIINDQLSAIDKDLLKNVIFEPCARNTSAAIALAAIHAANKFENPLLWIIPTDHIIDQPDELYKAVKESHNIACQGNFVLFGIKPTRADSSYGYIIAEAENHTPSYKVINFVEKPDHERLRLLMQHKHCWWNSGIFLFTARSFFREMKKHNFPLLTNASQSYATRKKTKSGIKIGDNPYSSIESISIDKAIMEKTSNLVVNPVNIGWSDVGSWAALWELSQQEGQGTPLENFLDKIAKAA